MSYRIEIIANGIPVNQIIHNSKTYLPLSMNCEFEINIYNDSLEKVVAIVSVDGLSVIDGQLADHDGSGYVIESNSYVNIDGWRQSTSMVATFTISGNGESYTEKIGHESCNRGVIGVVIIPEKKKCKSQYTNLCKCDGVLRSMSCSNQSSGTGWGNDKVSHSKTVDFNRDNTRKTIFTLYYDTIEALQAKGIFANTPNPFPAESNIYCTKPTC